MADFKWADLQTEGVTDLGRALAMVAEQLRIPPMSDRALPPVLVLISDGQPTDDFNKGLQALMNEPWGKKAVRIAIAIGEDADTEVLQKFIGHPELKPLQANNPEALVRSHQMGVHRRAEIRLLPGQSGGGRDPGPQRPDSHAARPPPARVRRVTCGSRRHDRLADAQGQRARRGAPPRRLAQSGRGSHRPRQWRTCR